MFDWLGLSADSTRILGWVFIGVAVILLAFLLWFAIQIIRDMKKAENKLKTMDAKLEQEKVEKAKKDAENKALTTQEVIKTSSETEKENSEKVEIEKLEDIPPIILNIPTPSVKEIKSAIKEQKIAEQITGAQENKPELVDETKAEVNEEIISKTSVEEAPDLVEAVASPAPAEETPAIAIIHKDENKYISALNALTDTQKAYYEQVKNMFCSFPEIENNLISDGETFKISNRVVGLLTVIDGDLNIYLKLSKFDLDDKFKSDETLYKKYERAPMQMALNDSVTMRRSLVSIERLASEFELFKSETYKPRKFAFLIRF